MKLEIHWNPLRHITDSSQHLSEKILRRGIWGRIRDTFCFLYGQEEDIHYDGKIIGKKIELGLLDYLNPTTQIFSNINHFLGDIFEKSNIFLSALVFVPWLLSYPLYAFSLITNFLLAFAITFISLPIIAITHGIIKPFVKKLLDTISQTEINPAGLAEVLSQKESSKDLHYGSSEEYLLNGLIRAQQPLPPVQLLGETALKSELEDIVAEVKYAPNQDVKTLDSLNLYVRNRYVFLDCEKPNSVFHTTAPVATIKYSPENYEKINAYIKLNMFHTAEALQKENLLENVKQTISAGHRKS